jgi:predicted nucleic acid-binding protein
LTRGVLLDTGPIYALLDPRDQYHTEARKLFGHLEAEAVPVHLAYPALLETHRLMLRRGDPSRAHGRVFAIRGRATVYYPVAADGEAAFSSLERFGDQRISLTDATIAAMAVRLGLQVVTFDRRHFGLMGSEVYG